MTVDRISGPVTSKRIVKKKIQRSGTIYEEKEEIDNFLVKIDEI